MNSLLDSVVAWRGMTDEDRHRGRVGRCLHPWQQGARMRATPSVRMTRRGKGEEVVNAVPSPLCLEACRVCIGVWRSEQRLA